MRFAVVSDLHANMQAWNAVHLDIRSYGADAIICLGDIVGYGPSPVEVLESVHANVAHFVLGNHDAVICGKLDSNLFNDTAQEIIHWTRDRLGPSAADFMKDFPLSLADSFFRCAHGDLSEPSLFNYVIDPEDALPSWRKVKEPLLLVGHTHRPCIFVLGECGTPHYVEAQDFVMEDDKRYLVNVGSVGQPRDGQSHACYCMLDTETKAVFWRRVPFDLDAYRKAVQDAGIPARASIFLNRDPRAGIQPLREMLSFSPATTKEEGAQNAVEVGEIKTLKTKVVKWRLLAALLLLVLLVVGTAAVMLGRAWWRKTDRSMVIADPKTIPLLIVERPSDVNILPVPSSTVREGAIIPAWSVSLGDKDQQGVSVASTDAHGLAFVMKSANADEEMRIYSPPIVCKAGTTLCAEALFLKEADFSGSIAMVVSIVTQEGDVRSLIDQYIVKEPNIQRQGGWLQAKKTFTLPAGAVKMQVQFRGRFKGRVTIAEPRLERKK